MEYIMFEKYIKFMRRAGITSSTTALRGSFDRMLQLYQHNPGNLDSTSCMFLSSIGVR